MGNLTIGDTEGDFKGNAAGRDIHIHNNDPELVAKIATLENMIKTQQEALQGVFDEVQLEATLAPLYAQLENLQAQLKEKPDFSPAPDTLQAAYLQRLRNEVNRIPLEVIDSAKADERSPLAPVYTALLTLSHEEREPATREREQAMREPKRLSAVAQLNNHARLVLIGDPGGGKSTFLDFVALCMAGQLLGHESHNLDLLRTPLPPDEEKRRKKDEPPQPQPWAHGPLVPVKVVLRKFATEGLPANSARCTVQHLWDYLAKQLHQYEADLAAYLPQLKHRMREEGALLMFDGLDEVPDPESRCPQLKQVIEDIAAAYPKCRILVTSRPYAYQNSAWQLSGFATTTLAPFTKPQIERFIDQWYGYLAKIKLWPSEKRQSRIEQLNEAIFSRHPRLRDLAQRPLLLTLMVNLHASRGTLPEKRAELYEETVKLLLDRWDRSRLSSDGSDGQTVIAPQLSEFLGTSQDDIRQLLQRLAFEAHQSQPKEAEGTANLDKGELLAGFMELTRREDIADWQLIEYLDQRAGIIISLGNHVYQLPHRTFQEYLAACHLAERGDFAAKTAELIRLETNRWREVVLLAAAKVAGFESLFWYLIDHLCPDAVGDRLARPDLMAALIGGQALVEKGVKPEKLSNINGKKVTRIKEWLKQITTSDLPVLERVTAGQALSHLGDDRPGVGVRFLQAE